MNYYIYQVICCHYTLGTPDEKLGKQTNKQKARVLRTLSSLMRTQKRKDSIYLYS